VIFEICIQLISGIASPIIFVPSFAIGWFARRWWQVALGAVLVAVLSEAEIMLIELPGAQPDWTREPLAIVPPLVWCVAGFLAHRWYAQVSTRRQAGPIRILPVVSGMVFGGIAGAMLALGVGLLFLRSGQLYSQGDRPSGYETVFFKYLFPGLLLGQLAGGLVGRLLGRPGVRPAGWEGPR
jgi:hypothetical protein